MALPARLACSTCPVGHRLLQNEEEGTLGPPSGFTHVPGLLVDDH